MGPGQQVMARTAAAARVPRTRARARDDVEEGGGDETVATTSDYSRRRSVRESSRALSAAAARPSPAPAFDYSLDYKSIDCRAHPECYEVGKGEQGVLMVEPYKSEILPHWRFSTPEAAQASSRTIYGMYEEYKQKDDFVGMDMARKFLQMGFTRSRRYANHPGGRKYRKGTREVLPFHEDKTKAECAEIFRKRLDMVKTDPTYVQKVKDFTSRHS